MALTADQSKALYGTPVYTGWGETEAMYDARNKGLSGGGSTSSDSASGYIDIAKKYAQSIADTQHAITAYETNNPFSFDEALTRTSVTTEYSPYYDQLLKDYTDNVERTKSRSAEDLKTTLDQLSAGKEYYTGVQRRALDTASRQTNEGYAGNGLFFSGARERDIKTLQTENQAAVGNYMSNYGYNTSQAELGNKRTIENQDTALSQYNRDTTQEKKYQIESGILDRKNQALTEYGIKEKNYMANELGTYYA